MSLAFYTADKSRLRSAQRRAGMHPHARKIVGRYKAIIVQEELHLLELARYVVLNPIRARMVRSQAE